MSWDEMLIAGLLGGVTGAAAAAGTWAIFSPMLDKQFDRAAADMLSRGEVQLRNDLERELQAQIPPMVSSAMDAKFREVGLTRETGQRISAVLALADRVGLIGVR